jgi:hypothetical protein
MIKKISRISLLAACVLCCTSVYAQSTFDPPTSPVEIRVEKATHKINIDGNLDEASWKYAKPITELVQYEPRQGEAPSLKTEIRILFDENNLYFSGVCYDSAGRKGIRVPNMQRDFSFDENDLLGIAIDGLLDKRNAMIFQTNPYGGAAGIVNQRWKQF